MMAQHRYCLVVALLMLTDCAGRENSPSNDYAGEYVFTPHEQPPAEFADFVVLRPDGTAVEIRYSRGSGQVSTTEKLWSVRDGKVDRTLVIGDFGHPIEGTGSKVRLVINSDLNEFYQKVR